MAALRQRSRGPFASRRVRRGGSQMGTGRKSCGAKACSLGLAALLCAADAAAAHGYAPHSYADPGRDGSGPFASSSELGRMAAPSGASRAGGGLAYCVRLCDGRYFPLQRHGDMTPAEQCGAFCPASRTKVFFGADIEGARAADGTRYASFDKAFVYRDRLVPDCTCNGKTSYGLAALDPTTDPTLRPGDMVATKDGLMTFQGARRHGAAFTPVDRSRLTRERLGGIAVAGRN